MKGLLYMKAVFFDRDNTLVIDTNYMHNGEDLCFFDETFSTLKELSKRGYQLFIVTNQSGIGRGFYTEEDMHKFNKAMISALEAEGIKITDLVFCPHTPEQDCDCRKPHPKMILNLCEKYSVDKSKSYMVGDKKSDLLAGESAGIHGIVLKPGDIALCLDYIA